MPECVTCSQQLAEECGECGELVHGLEAVVLGSDGKKQAPCAKHCEKCDETICNGCWDEHKEGEKE